MTPDRHARVRALFDAAVALPHGEREAYVEREAAGDAEVLAAVRALLAHAGESHSFEDLRRLDPEVVAAALGDGAGGSPETARFSPGSRIGGYRIVRTIAAGGMGIVCEAVDLEFPGERRVALKILKEHLAGSPERRERFLREAAAAGRLEHPSIAKVFATGEDHGLQYLAMELIDGPSLADVLRWRRDGCVGDRDHEGREIPDDDGWRRRATEKSCRVALSLARALESTHARGILHRDVKPSNVLIRPETGEPVLTDFGLARTEGDRSLTRTGDFVGTPYYVSPEQARGAEVDERTDVYSLGATLFELLALRVPFPEASTAQVLAKLVSNDEAPALRTISHEVPHDLDRVVAQALEKDVETRYPDSSSFAADLERFLSYRPVEARPLGPLTRLWRWATRHKAIATSIGLTILLLATGTGAAFVFRSANARSAFATAEASAKRGAWTDALAKYDEARRYGYDDDVAITIGRVEAWQGLADNEKALAELDRLERESDVGPHRAKILLLRGLIGHNRFLDPDAGLEKIEAALAIEDHPLSPADAAFARSYLATDLVDAKVLLEEALRLDPAHHGAIANLAFVLILLGSTDELDGALALYRSLAPENPNALGLEVLVRAVAGDSDRARILLDREGARLPAHLRGALDAALSIVTSVHGFIGAYEPVRGRENALADLDRVRIALAQLAPRVLQLEALLKGQDREEIGFEVALPPVAARLVRELVRFAVRFPFDRPEALVERLTRLIDREPLSILFQLRANLHYAAGRYRDAENDYDLAQRVPGPSSSEFRSICAIGVFSAQYHQVHQLRASGRPTTAALLDRVSRSLGAISRLDGLTPRSWEFVHSCAREVARPADVLAVAFAWKGEHPDDPDALAAARAAVAALDDE